MSQILAYWWPIGTIVIAHAVYQVSAKSVPEAMDPFAAVFFNYVIAMAASFVLWMVLGEDRSMTVQLGRMNWAPVAMALAITGVEVASVFMYKLGWNISIASTIGNIALAVVLIFVGALLFKEAITVKHLFGIALCIAGLIVMNR